MKSWQERLAAAGLLALFAGLVAAGLPHHSPTVDEFAHLPAGYHYWKSGDFSLYAKNPPLVKMIATLPWLILQPARPDRFSKGQAWRYATEFMRLNQADYIRLFSWGRVPIIFLALLLGVGIWRGSRRRYGPVGGLISLSCFCLCPNFLAHSGLATVDVGASLFFGAAVFAGLWYFERPSWPRAGLAGTALGLAQLAKFTSIFLIPLFLLGAALAPRLAREPEGKGLLHPKSYSSLRRLLSLTVILVITWLILWAGYRFEWDPYAFSDLYFRSQSLKWAQTRFDFLPLPVPPSYLDGFDAQLADAEHNKFPNYLFGRWYEGQKWYYFPFAIAVKTPIPILLAFLAALFFRRRDLSTTRSFWSWSPQEVALIVVMIVVYLGLTWRNQLQIGLRYLLPLYPLAYVLIGRLGGPGFRQRFGRGYVWVLSGLGVWLLIGTLRIHPHYLAYFNELGGGPDRGYRILLDSNLDWGQDLPGLADYLKEHQIAKVHLAYFGHVDPAIYGINYEPFQEPNPPGLTAISVMYLMGFPYKITYTQPQSSPPLEEIAPYRNRQPYAKIGYSIFLYQD